ncbi:c-type cytochrome [Pseudoxanthomonas koreensis]|uniref:c-type cytochrome n=1 Tax=Pseudoxanthomonas koreensis TaxID=266061 RepID=UPI001391B9B4|nr:c-type cytochrome [Pseudoxanthomonas koreensis]KAF1691243.1 cytochrome C [Pseudoxanthomonas koreensis]
MRPLPLAACLALVTALSLNAIAQDAAQPPAEPVAAPAPAAEAAIAPAAEAATPTVPEAAPAAAAPAVTPTGNPEAGRQLAYTCQGCHGLTGYKNAYPSFKVPLIGGQSAEYLSQALHEYRDGNRKHPTMQAQAQSFSDQDIADLATFLSTLK